MKKRRGAGLGSTGPVGPRIPALEGKGLIDRRRFIQSASGLFVAASVGVSCSDPGSPNAGTVRVVITGLGSGITSAGTATITGGDLPAPITIQLPPQATGEATVAAGSYHVVYQAPQGYAVAPGTPFERDVTVVAGNVTEVAFSVVQSSAGTGIVFRSDWGTALGRSDAAIRDTGKARPWEIYIGGQNAGQAIACSVIAATGLGFPTTNCLQVDCVVGNPHSDVQEFHTGEVSNLPGSGAWPVPGVGQSLYYRMYKRLVYPHHTSEPPPTGNNNHCVEERSGGVTNWQWTFYTNANGFNPSFNVWVGGTANRFRLGGTSPIYLARNTAFRFEWSLRRTGTNTREHEVRVYDSSGTLLHDTNDFATDFGGLNLSGFSATANVAAFDGLQLGTNGMGFGDGEGDIDPGEPSQSVIPAWYFAGIAVSNTDWCGPYSNGG